MVVLRARLGTHECGNIRLHGRCPRVVPIFEALLELIPGTTKFCLTLLLILLLLNARRGSQECGNLLFHGRCSQVVCIFEALLELILGTTKLYLTLRLLLILLLLNALRSRTSG